MQVGSSNSSAASQLQVLEQAALGQYQANQDFNLLLQSAGSGSGTASSSTSSGSDSSSSSSSTSSPSNSNGDWQLSGSFTGGGVYAVGTGFGSSFVPFSQQQIQSEQDAIQTQRKASYSDALQNFMTLSQASGQLANSTMSDQVKFTGDNGLIGGSFETDLSLKMVGGGAPSA